MCINLDSSVDMAESAGAGFKEDNLSMKMGKMCLFTTQPLMEPHFNHFPWVIV